MKRQFFVFLFRWAMNSFGIWISLRLLGTMSDGGLLTFVLTGLIFSVINSILKPIIIILSLPAILLTLGLFTLIINGLMVYLAIVLAPNVSITFGDAIIAGIILSLVNYIVSSVVDLRTAQKEQES
jgi:hypothetical protein cdiviTM7_00170